jgi:flagellar secretion chaperone FliS
MRQKEALHHYRQQALEFASPGEILVKLLDAAVQSCEEARGHIAAKDPSAKGISIGRAIAILGELEATLRHDAAPELAGQLANLYQFARDRLVSASINMDPGCVDEALKAIRPIRDAYSQVVRQLERRSDPPTPAGGFKAQLE